MAYAQAVNSGRVGSTTTAPSILTWASQLQERKHDLERVSGIRLVPPLEEYPPLAVSNRELIDFAELFLYNSPSVLKCTCAETVFPIWSQFMALYLRFQWPDESRQYMKWLGHTRQDIGAVREQLTDLDHFLVRVTFPGTIYALSLPVFFFQNRLQALCKITTMPTENGFHRVGNILWETDFLGVEWAITDMDGYKSIGRRDV